MFHRHSFAGCILLSVAFMATAGCEPQVRVIDVPVRPGPGCDFTGLLNPAHSGPALQGMVPGTMTAIPLDSARIIDPAISNKIMVQAVARRETPVGNAEVYSRLVNCTDFPQQVQVRTHFLDVRQIPTEQASGWRRIFLQPKSMGDYLESSTQRGRVANFLIEIREAQ